MMAGRRLSHLFAEEREGYGRKWEPQIFFQIFSEFAFSDVVCKYSLFDGKEKVVGEPERVAATNFQPNIYQKFSLWCFGAHIKKNIRATKVHLGIKNSLRNQRPPKLQVFEN